MSRVTVTKKDNLDELGRMIDEDIIGIIVRTHALTVNQIDQATGQLITGVVMRAEVYWENQRTPAFMLEDPADLFWMSFYESEDSEDDEDEGA